MPPVTLAASVSVISPSLSAGIGSLPGACPVIARQQVDPHFTQYGVNAEIAAHITATGFCPIRRPGQSPHSTAHGVHEAVHRLQGRMEQQGFAVVIEGLMRHPGQPQGAATVVVAVVRREVQPGQPPVFERPPLTAPLYRPARTLLSFSLDNGNSPFLGLALPSKRASISLKADSSNATFHRLNRV